MTGNFWFNGWASVGRVAVYAIVSYVLFLFLVRAFGKRTISKRNPSDFAITVAVGSIVANWVMQSPVSLVDGAVGITIVLGMQWLTETLTTRFDRFRSVTEGAPVLLLYEGKPCWDNMRREQINERELLLSLRQQGFTRMEDALAAILEIDGSVSVLPRKREREHDLLRDVHAHA